MNKTLLAIKHLRKEALALTSGLERAPSGWKSEVQSLTLAFQGTRSKVSQLPLRKYLHAGDFWWIEEENNFRYVNKIEALQQTSHPPDLVLMADLVLGDSFIKQEAYREEIAELIMFAVDG